MGIGERHHRRRRRYRSVEEANAGSRSKPTKRNPKATGYDFRIELVLTSQELKEKLSSVERPFDRRSASRSYQSKEQVDRANIQTHVYTLLEAMHLADSDDLAIHIIRSEEAECFKEFAG